MLLVQIPMDLTHVNVNLDILEMELHVTVRKLKLPFENIVEPPITSASMQRTPPINRQTFFPKIQYER